MAIFIYKNHSDTYMKSFLQVYAEGKVFKRRQQIIHNGVNISMHIL